MGVTTLVNEKACQVLRFYERNWAIGGVAKLSPLKTRKFNSKANFRILGIEELTYIIQASL